MNNINNNQRYRIAVLRSNRFISAQLINDANGNTICSVNAKEIMENKNKKEQAKLAGKILADKAKNKGVKRVFLDRRSYRYQGRIRVFAETLRENGLEL